MSRLALHTVAFLLVVALSCSAPAERKLLRQHIRRVLSFRCSSPRPMVVDVAELQEDLGHVQWTFSPPVTVLHRCGAGAGCCVNTLASCQAVEHETVELTFHVTDVFKRIAPTTITINALNHTRCDCVQQPPPPQVDLSVEE